MATEAQHVALARRRLVEHGARPSETLAPTSGRRLVLAAADTPQAGWRIAADLRAEGLVAVSRPDAGAARAAWERDTTPVVVGDRLTVCAACSEHDRAGLPGLVELAPGGFGTGRHTATRLVLEELADRIMGGERVLDVGCGNGVLGLAAVRLGAAGVVAVDIDPNAVEATRRGAVLNGMGEVVQASARPLGEISGSFDVVLANLGRSAAVELGPQLVKQVAAGGWLAVSGISPSQLSSIAGFLAPLVEVGRRSAGDWSVVVLGGG